MDTKNSGRASGISAAFSRLYVSSLTSGILKRLRVGALQLRLRVIGVFLSTFGIYTLIAALITHFFTSRMSGDDAVYFGICLAASSVPLLISSDNVSNVLTESVTGRMLCELLGLQRDAVRDNRHIGRMNTGFVAGVVAGTLTLIFSPFQILAAVLFIVAAAVILSKPGAGPALNMAGLLLFDSKTHCAVIAVTVISYALKIARGKRSLILKRTDAPMSVFMITAACGCLFSVHGTDIRSMLRFLLLMSSYFLCILLYRDCRRVIRLAEVACVSSAMVACIYICGQILVIALPQSIAPYSDTLLKAVNGLYAFSDGSAPSVLAAMLPLTVGLALRHHSIMSRSTLWLCAAAHISALMVMKAVTCLAAAALATVVMLIFIGRRNIYLVLTLIFSSLVLLMYTPYGTVLYSDIMKALAAETSDSSKIAHDIYLVCGRGFGAASGGDFYKELISALGIAGAVVFAVFILSVFFRFTGLVRMTVRSDTESAELRRFGAICSVADTRIGAAAPMFACISLLICGTFTGIWQQSVSFMLIWMLCGICMSYSGNAEAEFGKAKNAAMWETSAECAYIDVSVRP